MKSSSKNKWLSENYKTLYYTVKGRVRDAEAAFDIVQTAVERVLKYNGKERNIRKLAYACIRYATKDYYRKRDEIVESVEIPDTYTPEKHLENKEKVGDVILKIGEIPNDIHRTIVHLRLIDDAPYDMIAKSMGVSSSNARKIVERFKKGL